MLISIFHCFKEHGIPGVIETSRWMFDQTNWKYYNDSDEGIDFYTAPSEEAHKHQKKQSMHSQWLL